MHIQKFTRLTGELRSHSQSQWFAKVSLMLRSKGVSSFQYDIFPVSKSLRTKPVRQ